MSITWNRRLQGSVLMLALVASVAILAATRETRADAIARQVSGRVELGRGTPPVWTPLAVGDRIAPDEKVRTGADGRVELAVDAGTLRVHENSLLSLPPATADTDRVVLESGRSLFDVIRREGHRFEVKTPTVVVSVKGTRFGVESDGDAGVVSVYRGVVGVRASEGTDVVETLVREGFLATGGGGAPIELDVAPPGVDPWTAWQDLRAGAGSGPRTMPPVREKDVDRARAAVRHGVDVDVVKRASERKPELAERVREHLRETAKDDVAKDDSTRDGDGTNGDAGSDGGSGTRDGSDGGILGSGGGVLDSTKDATKDATTTDSPAILPASPDIRGTLDSLDGARGTLLDSSKSEGELDRFLSSIDTTAMTGGQAFPNGRTTLSADSLTGIEIDDVVRLVDGLQAVQSTYDASPTVGTPTTFATDLQSALVSDGMAPVDAQRLIDRLIGTVGQ